MSKTREVRADQVKVGDQVRGRGKVARVAAAGRWTRLWCGTRTNYDYRGDTILEVEIREGGFDPEIAERADRLYAAPLFRGD
ncbi:MAG: hypothetical protein OXG44_17445 [Gammaproteobacteria bacterium]|nr:hypothetical protein [Gammaproteobacteria bacterium]